MWLRPQDKTFAMLLAMMCAAVCAQWLTVA
jgi:hypothetical protein